jgi:hypothetical protein
MLGKKYSIIELNDLVYKERHDVKKQARVADDWTTNVFGLTASSWKLHRRCPG